MHNKDDRLRPFSGKHILVVEDEFLLAERLRRGLVESGARVVGPVGNVEGARALIAEAHIDAAILDISLNGEMVFAIAERLEREAIPFVFASAHNVSDLPLRYRKYPLCSKPVEIHQIASALFG
ncbi:MAG: response regulator [Martelella sp.]|uniref:response regulator n=1 Tax=Martelella sp. TaxID=1969699 RepID=UPI0032428BF9